MISALPTIINLPPLRTGMLYTDGARMLMLRSSPLRARRWISLTAGNQGQNGVRAKLWKHTRVNAAVRIGDNSIDDFKGHWVAYWQRMIAKTFPLRRPILKPACI